MYYILFNGYIYIKYTFIKFIIQSEQDRTNVSTYISEILAGKTLHFHVCSYLRNGGYEVEVEDVITKDGKVYLNLNTRICVVTKLCRFAGVYSEKLISPIYSRHNKY